MRRQIANRLGAAHIRDTVQQFVAGEIDRHQAMESLQIGKSQLYELRTSYLAAKAAGKGDEWAPGSSGGNHMPQWSEESQKFLRKVLSPGGDAKRYSYAFAASEVGRLHDLFVDRSQRFQMKRPVRGWSFERLKDRDLFNRWLDEELDLLDSVVLPQAEKNDIQVIVDLHSVPGGNGRIFHDSACVETFVDAWKRIATRFRGRENVYGYDLINEPAQGRKGVCDYWQLQDRAAHEIRRIDPSVAIVVEANSLDSPAAFAYLSPLAMDNVIYQVHVYNPGAYTHQGVGQGGREGAGFSWAAASKGDGKSYLRKVLNPVVAFQKRHGARILVGEFSAICWAPGAADYLRDAIEVFEENGWDWTYHAFREWRPWSVEHEGVSSAEMKPSSDNDRMRVLKEAFAAGRSR